MKKFIEKNNTVIEYDFTPSYKDSKKIEVEPNIFKHQGSVQSIYYFKDIYDKHGNTGKVKRIYLDLDHLKEILKLCEEIQLLEENKTINDLPW